MSVEKAKKSPSLNQFGNSVLIASSGKRFPLLALAPMLANGNIVTAAMGLTDGAVSQVTGLEDAPQVDGMPVQALAIVKPDGTLQSLTAYVAALIPLKFQSAVRVATGAEETIAHGLASVPSIVLISVYDNNAAAFVAVEGVHDATNLKATVTAGAKYKMVAFA
jgi:hypothetical protein